MKQAINMVDFEELNEYKLNPRRISDQDLQALKDSLIEFGFTSSVLVQKETNVIIGGHQRMRAWRSLYDEGMVDSKLVPVVYVEISNSRAKALNLALNKISGEWDIEILTKLMSQEDSEFKALLHATGFSEDEIRLLTNQLEKEFAAEDVDMQGDVPGVRKSLTFLFDTEGDYTMAQQFFRVKESESNMNTELLVSLLKDSVVIAWVMAFKKELNGQ